MPQPVIPQPVFRPGVFRHGAAHPGTAGSTPGKTPVPADARGPDIQGHVVGVVVSMSRLGWADADLRLPAHRRHEAGDATHTLIRLRGIDGKDRAVVTRSDVIGSDAAIRAIQGRPAIVAIDGDGVGVHMMDRPLVVATSGFDPSGLGHENDVMAGFAQRRARIGLEAAAGQVMAVAQVMAATPRLRLAARAVISRLEKTSERLDLAQMASSVGGTGRGNATQAVEDHRRAIAEGVTALMPMAQESPRLKAMLELASSGLEDLHVSRRNRSRRTLREDVVDALARAKEGDRTALDDIRMAMMSISVHGAAILSTWNDSHRDLHAETVNWASRMAVVPPAGLASAVVDAARRLKAIYETGAREAEVSAPMARASIITAMVDMHHILDAVHPGATQLPRARAEDVERYIVLMRHEVAAGDSPTHIHATADEVIVRWRSGSHTWMDATGDCGRVPAARAPELRSAGRRVHSMREVEAILDNRRDPLKDIDIDAPGGMADHSPRPSTSRPSIPRGAEWSSPSL